MIEFGNRPNQAVNAGGHGRQPIDDPEKTMRPAGAPLSRDHLIGYMDPSMGHEHRRSSWRGGTAGTPEAWS